MLTTHEDLVRTKGSKSTPCSLSKRSGTEEQKLCSRSAYIRGASIFMKQITIIALSSVAPKVHLLYPLRFVLVEVYVPRTLRRLQRHLTHLTPSRSPTMQNIK